MEIGKERITNSWYYIYIYTHTHTLAYWPALCSRSIIKKKFKCKKKYEEYREYIKCLGSGSNPTILDLTDSRALHVLISLSDYFLQLPRYTFYISFHSRTLLTILFVSKFIDFDFKYDLTQ